MGIKVAIASTVNPFVDGGANCIVDWLEQALLERGHEVETIRIPFSDHPSAILEQLVALRLIDLSGAGERLITIRTPSHLLKHPNKVVWFIHHYRGAYDLWGTQFQNLPATPEGDACRRAIVSADNAGLGEARKIFCNSAVTAERLRKYNQIEAEVLYPPLRRPEQFESGGYGDYLLYVSRVNPHKRQALAIESLRYTKTPVRLVIAGKPDPECESYVASMESLIAQYKLGGRVTLLTRWVSQQEKIQLFANCLAAVYFPLDEDSYGYTSLEAHAARRAVLTTSDAGGTLELITDGVNGLVAPASPQAIAGQMDALYSGKEMARRMGDAGARRVRDLGIDWDHVIDRLLSI